MTATKDRGGRPKEVQGETTVVTVYLQSRQVDALDSRAAQEGTSRSEQIRKAIDRYLLGD